MLPLLLFPVCIAIVVRADPESCSLRITYSTLESQYYFEPDDTQVFSVDIAYTDCANQEIATILNSNDATLRCNT